MILEDGWDLELTQRFEALREEVGWKPEEPTAPGTLKRDRVAAVWKLSLQPAQTRLLRENKLNSARS
jgi:hypothetical protein